MKNSLPLNKQAGARHGGRDPARPPRCRPGQPSGGALRALARPALGACASSACGGNSPKTQERPGWCGRKREGGQFSGRFAEGILGHGIKSGRDTLPLWPSGLGKAWQVIPGQGLQQDLKRPLESDSGRPPRSAHPAAVRRHLPVDPLTLLPSHCPQSGAGHRPLPITLHLQSPPGPRSAHPPPNTRPAGAAPPTFRVSSWSSPETLRLLSLEPLPHRPADFLP